MFHANRDPKAGEQAAKTQGLKLRRGGKQCGPRTQQETVSRAKFYASLPGKCLINLLCMWDQFDFIQLLVLFFLIIVYLYD